MKQNKNRRIMMSVYAMTGMMVLTGFTSLAAEPENTDTGKKDRPEQAQERMLTEQETLEWSFTEIAGPVQKDTAEAVKAAVKSAHETYLMKKEAERKAEEERRIAAEKAAAEKAAAERAAAEQEAQEAARAQAGIQSVSASVSEQELLAALIFCEAGNQPYEGQVAVGAVVMNRVNSGIYPNSITDVIYQSGQFTPAMTGWLDSVLAGKGYTEAAMQAAADALAGYDPVEGCLYFSTGGYGIQIGDHFFH